MENVNAYYHVMAKGIAETSHLFDDLRTVVRFIVSRHDPVRVDPASASANVTG